jgi:signal transduction histidine kinase/CheY-like chemotaxis protein/PAS domain-containing protein
MPDLPGLSLPPRFEMAGVVPPYFAERILNALPAHIAVLDSEGTILAINAAWKQFVTDSAWSTAEYGIGTDYLQVCERASGPVVSEMREAAHGIRSVLTGEADFFSLEYSCTLPTGLRWFQMMVTPMQDDTARGAIVVHNDITARRQTEESAQASQSRLRLLADIAAEIVSRVSIDEIIAGTVRRLSEYFSEFQVAYATVSEANSLLVTHSDEPTGMKSLVGVALDLNIVPEFHCALQSHQLVTIPDVRQDASIAPIREALLGDGISALLDVTLKHPNEQSGVLCLNARTPHVWSEHEIAMLQEVAQYLAFAIWNAHVQQEHLRAERALHFSNARLNLIARVTGAVVGATPLEHQAAELAEQVRQAFEVDSCIIRTLEGEDLVFLASAGVPQDVLKSRLPAKFGISEEILASLRPIAIPDVHTYPGTRPIVAQLPEGYRFISYAGAPLLLEDHAIGLLGIYSRTKRREFTDTDLEHLQIVANHAAIAIENNRLYREVERQKEQFLQAQKLESIGRLAGGIAHDFNNLLTAVLGYAELISDNISADDPHQAYLSQIQRAGNRAADLTRQLLTFARKQIIQPRPVNLAALVQNTDKMLRPLIGEDIELVIQSGEDLSYVEADPGQCEQVLVNLVVNARDAMPEGGTLLIETANVSLDPGYAQRSQVAPGPYVMLAVSDTGLGMDEETQTHIFEPFYTTKEVGKGTGLGLATCYGIVTQARGHIAVYSELGHGTTFRIYLPRIEAAAESLAEQKAALPVKGGRETILLVEDEPQVREIASTTLRGLGYTVLSAADGHDALYQAAAHKEKIQLLVTDVVMPQMNGREVARRLSEIYSNLHVLYVSGYTENILLHHETLTNDEAFLSKPFSPAELARKVRQTLDRVSEERTNDQRPTTNDEGKRQKAKGESPIPNIEIENRKSKIENPTPDTRHPTPKNRKELSP